MAQATRRNPKRPAEEALILTWLAAAAPEEVAEASESVLVASLSVAVVIYPINHRLNRERCKCIHTTGTGNARRVTARSSRSASTSASGRRRRRGSSASRGRRVVMLKDAVLTTSGVICYVAWCSSSQRTTTHAADGLISLLSGRAGDRVACRDAADIDGVTYCG